MAHMSDEAKAARRQYRKEWYRRNPDKQREYTARYWERKAKEMQTRAADETRETAEMQNA